VPSGDVDGLPREAKVLVEAWWHHYLKSMNCHSKKVSRSLFFDQLELFPVNDLPTWSGHINAFCFDSNQTLQGTHDAGIENNPRLQFSHTFEMCI
jgi:hypothetical protein